MKMFAQRAGGVVFDGTKQRSVGVVAVACHHDITVNGLRGDWVDLDVADFGALAVNHEIKHALALREVLDAQTGELIAAQPVIEKG